MVRADIELAVVSRCGNLAAEAGLDGVTVDGTNADMNDPIADALEALNRAPANRSAVSDADVLRVAPLEQRHCLALAELRYLESALFNLTLFDEKWVNQSDAKSQLGKRLECAIAARRDVIARRWGDTGGPFASGPIGGPIQPVAPAPGRPRPANPKTEVDISTFIP